jgi:hypothetical protein
MALSNSSARLVQPRGVDLLAPLRYAAIAAMHPLSFGAATAHPRQLLHWSNHGSRRARTSARDLQTVRACSHKFVARDVSQGYASGVSVENEPRHEHLTLPMKAAIVPAANRRWEVKQTETPEPGPGQVLIKIHASGLCYTDVHQTRGELPGDFPRILGHEPVGEIVAVGPSPKISEKPTRSAPGSRGRIFSTCLRVILAVEPHGAAA